MKATTRGHTAIVELLLGAGADKEAKNNVSGMDRITCVHL